MDILILVLIGIALFFAIRHMKKHPNKCSGNCAGCGMNCKHKPPEVS